MKSRLEVPDLDLSGMPGSLSSSARTEVRDALTNLGYSSEEVRDVLGQLSDDAGVEDLLRNALRMLAGGR